ncbi:MAG TPA: hypothetical protein PK639_03450 [Candidatus Woesebacteria bacterium]|nr:hypothetical protein [Candidatus Woesebacteria bacterium]
MILTVEKCGGPVGGSRIDLDMSGFCPITGCLKTKCFWHRVVWGKRNKLPVLGCFQGTRRDDACANADCKTNNCMWRERVDL